MNNGSAMWNEEDHPRDEQGRFTNGGAKEWRQNTPYEEIMNKHLTVFTESDMIKEKLWQGKSLSDEEIYEESARYSQKYQFDAMRRSGKQDECLREILKTRGWDKPPQKISASSLLEKLRDGDFVYRGLSQRKYVNDFYNGELFVGQGPIFGNGIYVSFDKNESLCYSNGEKTNVAVAVLPRDIKIAPEDLKAKHGRFLNFLRQKMDEAKTTEEYDLAENQYNMMRDFGKYCALKGYEAYSSQKGKNLVLLNRNILFVGENNEQERVLADD